MLNSTILYYTILYYTILYYTILYYQRLGFSCQGEGLPYKLNFAFEGLATFVFRHWNGNFRREARKNKHCTEFRV